MRMRYATAAPQTWVLGNTSTLPSREQGRDTLTCPTYSCSSPTNGPAELWKQRAPTTPRRSSSRDMRRARPINGSSPTPRSRCAGRCAPRCGAAAVTPCTGPGCATPPRSAASALWASYPKFEEAATTWTSGKHQPDRVAAAVVGFDHLAGRQRWLPRLDRRALVGSDNRALDPVSPSRWQAPTVGLDRTAIEAADDPRQAAHQAGVGTERRFRLATWCPVSRSAHGFMNGARFLEEDAADFRL